jgi:hypothetical protein
MSFGFLYTALAFFTERLSNLARVSVAFFPRFAQNLMLFLYRIHGEIASCQIHVWSRVSGMIHDFKRKELKKSVLPPSCVKFCILKPKIC